MAEGTMYTVKEAAEELGVRKEEIYALIHGGAITPEKEPYQISYDGSTRERYIISESELNNIDACLTIDKAEKMGALSEKEGGKRYGTNVRETRNYDMFKTFPGNRKVDAAKMRKIEKSIDEIGELPIPIIVNERMEVVDGQHRLEVYKKKGLPVFYMIITGIGARECSVINNSMTTWEIKDYIDSYADQGVRDYARLRELVKDYPEVNMTTLASIAANVQMGGTTTDQVKRGVYKLSAEREKSVRETLTFVASLYESEKKLKANGKRVSQMALAWVYENSAIDKKRVQKTFPTAVWRLNHEGGVVVNVSEALELIEDGYNYGLTAKNRCELVREYDHYCERIGGSAGKNRGRR